MVAEASAERASPWGAPRRAAVALTARREAQLVARAQRGESAAVEELFAAFWPVCHRAAWLITQDRAGAEDVAQEAFVAAIAALDRFDRRRRLEPWLRTIVARRAIDHARTRTARREVADDAVAEAAAAGRGATGALSPQLAAALGALSIDRRAVVVLRFLLELTPREIAQLLEVPVGTVNSRTRRALDELRALTEARHG